MFRFLQPELVPVVNDPTYVVVESKNERNTQSNTLSAVRSILRAMPSNNKKKQHGRNSTQHPLRSIVATSFTANSGGTYTFPLSFQGAIKSSGAGGTAYEAIGINPALTTNWTALSALFDVYRIDSIILSVVPVPVNTGSTAPSGGIMAICVDTDSTTPPTAIDQLIQYDDVWCGNPQNPPGNSGFGFPIKPYKYRCPVASNGDGSVGPVKLGQWVDIAAVAATGAVFIATELATPSVFLHAYFIQLMVEFKFVR